MKPIKKSLDRAILGILVAPFLYAASVWDQLPARLVSHYNFQGQPDGTQPKETFLLLMLGLQVLIYLLLRYAPGAGIFPNNQPTNYHRLRLVVTLFVSGTVAWVIYAATQPGLVQNSSPILLMVMGLLAAIGNYITTIRPNFFVGIRTPWTLFNDTVWRKTHQMAGRLWVGGSLLGAILLMLVPTDWQVPVLVSVVVILVLIPTVYSYLIFRQEKQRVA